MRERDTRVQPITAFRESFVDLPWPACSRALAQVLTSDDWSSERAQLVGRTSLHFAIALRGIESASDSVRFRLIADSPDLRHPLTGHVEVAAARSGGSSVRVALRADLSEEPSESHLMMRESIASLADVLGRTLTALVEPPVDEVVGEPT